MASTNNHGAVVRGWPIADGVTRIASARLVRAEGSWAFAAEHCERIDQHWHAAQAANPNFFNGTIYLVCDLSVDDGHLEARLIPAEFKSFVFWRHQGFPASGVLDVFGSGLILARDGEIVLGHQRGGNINGGLVYAPSGFIDNHDIGPSGEIDITASIAREVREETGLIEGTDLAPEPGLYLTRSGTQISIARAYRSSASASEIVARVRAHIAADPDPELMDAVLVSRLSDLDGVPMLPYARLLVTHVLREAGRS